MSDLPDGFALYRNWHALSHSEIESQVSWECREIRIFGRVCRVPRLTAWYGAGGYTYSGIENLARTIPLGLDALRLRLEGCLGSRFNSVLANQYRSGADSVAWHADDEPELGQEPVIASLSFGASRRFAIKPRHGRGIKSLELHHGDLLVMSGRSQIDWLHAVPKMAGAVGARINLTFRYVKV